MFEYFLRILGPLEELFSVEINHGGLFCGHGTNKTYLDCQTDYFDNCEVDTWSPLWIRDFLMELGIDADRMQVAWKLPGKGFADGLRIIASDSDTIMRTAVVPKFQLFRLFVTEKDLFDGLCLDDICILGSPNLPPVISPKQMSKQAGSHHVGLQAGSDDDDINYGEDFVDSDNEIDQDDDDIFEEWVDHEGTGKKKETEWVDDDYNSDDLDLPPSDSEYEEDEDEVEEETKKRWRRKQQQKEEKGEEGEAHTVQT
jgi:hypothetical protein